MQLKRYLPNFATGISVPHTTNTEVVCITEEDKDIVEYIAGFAAHRVKHKAYRLKCSEKKTTTLELVSALIRPTDESTSALVNCQQHGGLLSVHGNILHIFNALELMFRQSTNSTITRQIDLQNLVHTAVNDASLLTLYNGCVNDVSAITSRKNDMFQELTLIYFMDRVNGILSPDNGTIQTRTQDVQTSEGIEEISSVNVEEMQMHEHNETFFIASLHTQVAIMY